VEEDKILPATWPKDFKILMVDDNELTRFLARAVLKKIGWQMDEAENGKQALEKLSVNRYDLLLMDIQMPEMDGLEATTKIRTETKTSYSQIPIFACIADTTEANLWKEAGMNDCIAKPINAEELVRKVATLTRNNSPFVKVETKSSANTEERPAPAEDNDIINLQKLIALSGNSMATVNNIIQVFLSQIPKQMENLTGLVAQEDWDSVQALSHKMKSSYAILGANSVKSLLETMEADCKHNNIDEARFKTLMAEIILLNDKVITSIRSIAA
jgi:CheY-like chemotaxis protein/HPt (histidine-containing phosphotransfer) domain-containing protein